MKLHLGDCLDVLDYMPSNSIDACVTDPPYHLTSIVKRFGKTAQTDATKTSERARDRSDGMARLSAGFMGKQWDGGDVAFRPETWAAVLRVLKPGAHLIAFGGTRTYHRLACAVDDAGFEIRDMIAWTYGSGFPKSHNLDGDWEGWGTALKPALEPVVFARKPLIGTVAQNMAAHRTGALNIDGCRVPTDDPPPVTTRGGFVNSFEASKNNWGAGDTYSPSALGRWPANLIHDGSDKVLAAFPDSGSAARFFYAAKASRSDRNDGLGDDFTEKPLNWSSGTQSPGAFQAEGTHKAAKNNHPTVKPTELMRYLCRLVTPPGGTVLDPFMGSGSTGRGAALEGFGFVGIEREAEYMEIAKARIAAATPPKQGVFE